MSELARTADSPGPAWVGKQVPPHGQAGQPVIQARSDLEHARDCYLTGHFADSAKIAADLAERLPRVACGDAERAVLLGSACTLLGLTACARDEPPGDWFSRAAQAFAQVPAGQLDQGIGVIAADYGIALHHTGAYQQALAELERAMELGQDTPDVRRYRAAAFRDRNEPGDRERAHALLVTACERAPLDWQAWEWLAALSGELRRDPAEEAAQWAAARRVRIGARLLGQAARDGQRALTAYQRAVTARPADIELLLAAATAMAETGQRQEAAALLRRTMTWPAGTWPAGPPVRLAVARRLINLGDGVAAAQLAGDVLTAEPDNEQAVTQLARSLALLGDEESHIRAEARLAAFLRSHPDSVPAEAQLGEVCRLRGVFGPAIAHFDRALAGGGEHDDELAPFLHGSKGQALMELGRDADGLAELRAASERGPDLPWVRTALAEACYRAGDVGAAIATLRELITRYPPEEDRETWLAATVSLGSILTETGDSAEAITILRQVPEPEAHDSGVLGPLTSALLDTGQERAALAAISEAEQVAPGDLNVRTLHARVLYRVGRLDEAARLLAAVLDQDGGRWRDRAWLGEVERMRGHLPAALQQLNQVLAEQQDNVWSLSSRAAVHLGMGAPGKAEADLRRCLHSDPRDLFSLRVLRDLLIPQGRYRELVTAFRRALRAPGSEPSAQLWDEFGRLLRMLGGCREAADVLGEVERDLIALLANDPRNMAMLRALRELLISQERYGEAVSQVRKALDAPGPDPGGELWREYGETLRQAGRYADARAALDTALRCGTPGEVRRAWHALGQLMLDQGRPDEAVPALDRAARDTSAPAVWYDAFTARILSGRYTEARDQLCTWLGEHSSDAEAWWLLGQVYYRVGAWPQAALAAAAAARYDRDDAKKSELLGWALLRAAADLPGAQAAFARAAELEPALLSPLRGEAHALWLAGLDDLARAMCQRLVDEVERQRRPGAYAQAIRGWGLARLGRPLDAIVDYLRVLPGAGENRVGFMFDLAVCQFQADQPDNAAITLGRAWLDRSSPDPASQKEPELRRRGILGEILQDLRTVIAHDPAVGRSETFAGALDRLADELQRLPVLDAGPVPPEEGD